MNERERYPASADITLRDLLDAVWRQRTVIVLITLAIGTLGSAWAWLREPVYGYTTLIEIGQKMERDGVLEFGENRLAFGSGEPEPIERANDVTEKLEGGYIGEVIRTYREEAGVPERPLGIEVARSTRSLVQVRSEGTEDDAEHYKALHSRVVARLRDDHAAPERAERRRLERQLKQAKAAAQHAGSLAPAVEDELKGVRALRERADLLQRVAEARAAVEEYQARLQALRPTRATTVALRSEQPFGPGTAVLSALSWILGAVAGLLVGGFVQVVRRD